MSDVALYEKNDRIVTITLNKPETRNALSKDLCEALVDAINKADADPGVSCVVLAANGKSFSSGGNLHEIKAMTAEQNMTPLEIENWYKTGIQRIPLSFSQISVPVIAAVNGHAIGAGNDLTTMCDIRIAGEDAIFAESFLRVGIIPGDGGAWLLPRRRASLHWPTPSSRPAARTTTTATRRSFRRRPRKRTLSLTC